MKFWFTLMIVAFAASNAMAASSNTMCNRTFESPQSLLQEFEKAKAKPVSEDKNSITYADGNKTWTFTKPGGIAYPAVTCRSKDAGNTSTSTICNDDSAKCNALSRDTAQ